MWRRTWLQIESATQVVYPAAFVGDWSVTARLQNVSFPFGMAYINKEVPGVTKSSMIAALPDVGAGMDNAVRYPARFASAGGGAVPDRQYNQRALLDAFLGYAATQSVEYDRAKNPQRVAVVYKTPRRDLSVQTNDLRKAELFFNASRFDADTNAQTFALTEAVRQVNQARQSGFVYDYEIIQKFAGVGSDEMGVDMRVAAFLVPEAPGFFKTQGAAVALYDYKLQYLRLS